jgi:hypothetical protein
MADFAGYFIAPNVELNPSHLAFGPGGGGAPRLAVAPSAPVSGAKALGSPALPPGIGRAGSLSSFFGDRCIFERVLVIPEVADAGAVLTQVTIIVDLWNTYRNVMQKLTALTATGPGNAVVTLPTLPLVFVPLGFLAQSVVLPTEGDPIIAELLTFVFPGQTGTTLTLTGTRLAVFTIPANWDDQGITEKPQQWLTDVLMATSEQEQRVQLRTIYRTQVKFRVIADGLTKALLEALLWGWQAQVYGVPFWPDAQPLLEGASSGDTSVFFDTTDRGFVANGLLLIWRDAFTYEVTTITALISGGVAINAAHDNWLADGQTFCVPVRRGRLAESQEVKRTTSTVAEVELTFDCEVV